MLSSTSCRPSRMWMRSSTLASRCSVRSLTVCWRNADPLDEDLAQALQRRPAVAADHRQVDRRRALEAGVREQRVDQFLRRDRAALGLEDEAHRRVAARLVARGVEHAEDRRLQLQLLGAQRLLAGLDLRVGELLDLLEHPLRARAGRQLGDDQLPLAAREILDLPARAHLEAAAAGGVGVADVGGAADDLAAAGKVGAGDRGVAARRR